MAIAAYERTPITPNTAYDRCARRPQCAESSADARHGAMFQSIGCIACHFGANFSGASTANLAAGDPAAVATDK